jgi:ribosome-associated protein
MTRPVPSKTPRLSSQEIARLAARFALERKANRPVILDLRQLEYLCDFYVVVDGESDPQIRAIVERIEEGLKEHGESPWHVEGLDRKQWVLLDYVDVVIHVFRSETRDLYLLEKLWGDAPREEIDAGIEGT